MSEKQDHKRKRRDGEGGGGGGEKKENKKAKYYGGSKGGGGQALPLGSTGILVTCDSGWEEKAGYEAVGIIEEHYDKLAKVAAAGNSAKGADQAKEGGGKDIASLLAAEVAELKDKKTHRFRIHSTGVKGTVYILFPSKRRGPAAAAAAEGGDAADASTGADAAAADGAEAAEGDDDIGGPSPVDVAVSIVEEAAANKQCRSRHCVRFLPVSLTCFAGMDEIKEAAPKALAGHFPEGEGVEAIGYAVDYEHRACDGFDRLAVINCFAELIKAPHKVNLKEPAKTVLVELMRNGCAMAVVPMYKALAKYNVRRLAEVDEATAQGKGKDHEA